MFRLFLEHDQVKGNVSIESQDVEYELDSTLAILDFLCEKLADHNLIKFQVSGFGDDSWAVDCYYDLPIILEQLPDILRKIQLDEFNFALNFEEQGVERVINFKSEAENLILTCISNDTWIPNPKEVLMTKTEVEMIFSNLFTEFQKISEQQMPQICRNIFYMQWKNLSIKK